MNNKKMSKKNTAVEHKADESAKLKLLHAASKLFAEKGLEGTSTRDISKESGMNLSLISYYYGGKEGLYAAVIREFSTQARDRIFNFLEKFEKIELDKESLKDVVLGLVDIFIDLRDVNPHAIKIFTREQLANMPYSKDVHDEIFHSIGEKLKGIIVRAQKKSLVNKKLNPDFFMCCLSESVFGYLLMLDCEATSGEVKQVCYDIPAQKDEFKKQIGLIFIEGILK